MDKIPDRTYSSKPCTDRKGKSVQCASRSGDRHVSTIPPFEAFHQAQNYLDYADVVRQQVCVSIRRTVHSQQAFHDVRTISKCDVTAVFLIERAHAFTHIARTSCRTTSLLWATNTQPTRNHTHEYCGTVSTLWLVLTMKQASVFPAECRCQPQTGFL